MRVLSQALTLLIAFCLATVGCGRADYKATNSQLAYESKSESGYASIEQRDQLLIENQNTEEYDDVEENDFLNVLQNPQSTFSIDVDTASYSNVRRLIQDGLKPPAGAVRIEEMVNYFSYNYPQPDGDHPFSVSADIAECPWEPDHQLVRIGLKGREFPVEQRPASNLVFLIDVSGSMDHARKLPLVKSAFQLLLNQLDKRDTISIVVYAGASGLVLPTTSAASKSRVLTALNRLSAGGSTNGGDGIHLAYTIAKDNFIEGGINRVILCTDGDFNVGVTNRSDLVELIQEKAKDDIFLSVLGFGTGNYKDATMERLADKGNGNYAYIDSLLEARKTLVQQMNGTLVTIAKDVKIQVDFNPSRVKSYRLIGYENRLLRNEDFEDDEKDAGEIGAGHTVTALYEIVPVGISTPAETGQESEFVETRIKEGVDPNKVLKVSLRYKEPEEAHSHGFEKWLISEVGGNLPVADSDFQFAAAVAGFGMLLRESKYSGSANLDWVLNTAENSLGPDEFGFRKEFVKIVQKAKKRFAN